MIDFIALYFSYSSDKTKKILKTSKTSCTSQNGQILKLKSFCYKFVHLVFRHSIRRNISRRKSQTLPLFSKLVLWLQQISLISSNEYSIFYRRFVENTHMYSLLSATWQCKYILKQDEMLPMYQCILRCCSMNVETQNIYHKNENDKLKLD